MKQTIQILAISIFCLSFQFSFGQTKSSVEKEVKPYIVWVTPINQTYMVKGYLSEVGDTLVITPIYKYNKERQIRLDEVNYLKFRRKGVAKKSILIGSAVGFGIGALVGMTFHTPCGDTPCQNFGIGVYALGGGVVGVIPGFIIGGIIGGKKIKIPIQKSNKSIQAQKEELRKYKFGG